MSELAQDLAGVLDPERDKRDAARAQSDAMYARILDAFEADPVAWADWLCDSADFQERLCSKLLLEQARDMVGEAQEGALEGIQLCIGAALAQLRKRQAQAAERRAEYKRRFGHDSARFEYERVTNILALLTGPPEAREVPPMRKPQSRVDWPGGVTTDAAIIEGFYAPLVEGRGRDA